jgi:hypothetical protein
MTDYPDKPLQPWVPKSMRNSGADLDPCCEGAGTATASEAAGMDAVFNPITTKEKP